MAKDPSNLPFYMSRYFQTEMTKAAKSGKVTDANRASIVKRIKTEMKLLGIKRRY